jgi:ABC-2 type transport system permease protein
MVKEFLALLKDKRSRTVIIIPPLLQLMVFGYAATYDLNQIPCAVYDQDRSAASRQLVARFEGTREFRLVRELKSTQDIGPAITRGEVLAVLNIGARFSRELLQGRSASLHLVVDGRDSNVALICVQYVTRVVQEFSRQWTKKRGQAGIPARLNVRAWFNPNLKSRWFIVPGIVGLLTLVVTMLVTALSVAREREAGTFDQLLVTPYRPAEILIGKALPAMIIGVAEASLIVLVAVLWFDVPLLGSLPALYMGLFLFVLSSIGVGLMISSLAVTQQQGLLGAFMFIVPSVTLSGFATPIANMPVVVQYLTLANPMRYFLVVLRSVFLEGARIDLLWHNYWPMALIGLTCLALAGFMFRRRLY